MHFNFSNNILPASFAFITNCLLIVIYYYSKKEHFLREPDERAQFPDAQKNYFHKKHSNVRKLKHHQSLLERLNVVFPLPDADVHFLTSNIEKYDDRCTNCVESAFITLPDLLSIQYLLCTYIIM